MDGRIHLHYAQVGYRIERIRNNEMVSFCVVQRNKVVPSGFSTDYRSAIVIGRAKIVTDGLTRRRALQMLNEKCASEFPDESRGEMERCWHAVCIVEMEIERVAS